MPTSPAGPGNSEPAAADAPRGGAVEQLTRQNVARVLALEGAEQEKATWGDQVARAITGFSGSLTFVWINALAIAAWIGFNVAAPHSQRFDPFPFSLLTLLLSVEAIFLAIFILISQNRDALITEKRANLDLQLNLLSEQENTKMILMLERIGVAVGLELANDPDIQALAQEIRPESISEQLDEVSGEGNKDEDR